MLNITICERKSVFINQNESKTRMTPVMNFCGFHGRVNSKKKTELQSCAKVFGRIEIYHENLHHPESVAFQSEFPDCIKLKRS